MPTTTLAAPVQPLFDEARLAIAGFLARYGGPTRRAYATDLRQYFAWCAAQDLDVFAVRRGHLELWARSIEERGLARATVARRLSTVAGFYRFAVVDGLLAHSPAEFVRRPKVSAESPTLGLDRMELSAFVACAAAGGAMDHALACLLGLLGLRVSEACSIDIDDLGTERGHRTVTVLGKGGTLAVIPLPTRVARALDLAARERISGPLLLARSGLRMNRHAATRIVHRLAKAAGITKHVSPHSLRHSFITAVFSSPVVVVGCLRERCVMHVGDTSSSYRHRRVGLFRGGSRRGWRVPGVSGGATRRSGVLDCGRRPLCEGRRRRPVLVRPSLRS